MLYRTGTKAGAGSGQDFPAEASIPGIDTDFATAVTSDKTQLTVDDIYAILGLPSQNAGR